MLAGVVAVPRVNARTTKNIVQPAQAHVASKELCCSTFGVIQAGPYGARGKVNVDSGGVVRASTKGHNARVWYPLKLISL